MGVKTFYGLQAVKSITFFCHASATALAWTTSIMWMDSWLSDLSGVISKAMTKRLPCMALSWPYIFTYWPFSMLLTSFVLSSLSSFKEKRSRGSLKAPAAETSWQCLGECSPSGQDPHIKLAELPGPGWQTIKRAYHRICPLLDRQLTGVIIHGVIRVSGRNFKVPYPSDNDELPETKHNTYYASLMKLYKWFPHMENKYPGFTRIESSVFLGPFIRHMNSWCDEIV